MSCLFTDLPAIASGDRIAIFDPHEEYFRDEKGRGNSVNMYYFEEGLLEEETSDQFMPFHDVFGCNLEDSDSYEGTLFRFPLRTKASELSDKEYTKEKVMTLFDSLQEEASVVLLFLKNICSISLYDRSKNGTSECIFKVEISEDSRDEVMKRRQEFLSKATTTSEIADCKYVMNIKVMKDSATKEYRWLVVNQIGSKVEHITELATKENLPPWVGMALPLNLDSKSDGNMDTGRIFCFLPLPPDVDCLTGLPVHVHGAFALTDNRRGLVWPGADNKSSTAEWNKLLLENVAVDVYSKLIHVLLQNSPSVEIDECSRSQLVYLTLPCKTKAKGHWSVILDPLFKKLSREEWRLFLAKDANGHSWVKLQDAIVDRVAVKSVREIVLRALLCCFQTVISNVPDHVLHMVDEYFPASRDITPGLLRSVLKTHHEVQVTREDKLKLLEFILQDEHSTEELQGVPLLPLANLEFSIFTSNSYNENPSSSVLVATTDCPKSVLPNLDHRFLCEDIPTTLKEKFQNIASKDLQSRNATQLVLINKDIVLQNLRSCLPMEWLNDVNEIVEWMPGNAGHPSESWLQEIWDWINSHFPDCLESFVGLPLIPLPVKLGVLSKQSKFIFATDVSGNSLPDVVVKLVTASGCIVVPNQSSALRHSDINTYIAAATPTGVMTVLSRTSLEKIQGHIKARTLDERHKIREFLSHLQTIQDPTERNLLLRLPLFDTLNGCCAAIQSGNDIVFVAESNFTFPQDFKFRKCNQIISSADTSSQQLLHLLDTKTLNSAEVIVQFLFPDIATMNVYSLDETAKIMLWVIERVFEFKSQCDKFIDEMKNLQFVPTEEGRIVKPSELYDPGNDTLLKLFHSEPNKFPRHDYNAARVVSILRDEMGLRTIDKITANELFQVAAGISTSSQESSSCKLQALEKILNNNAEYLDQNVSTGFALKSELLRIKWLPCAIKAESVLQRFPPSMPWFTRDAQYFTPPELCDKRHALVVGSSMPILNIDLSENVREKLGLTADPPVQKIVTHLQIAIQVWSNVNERKVCPLYKEMVVAIYTQLARCSKETVIAQMKDTSVENWIWQGAGFCAPSKISLETDIPLDLRPQLFVLPEELKGDVKLEQLFLESGVRAKFSEQDIISVLPALKEKHEASGLQAADVEKDLKLCRSILEWLVESEISLSESIKENLLFPVESEEDTLILKHYTTCAYCDYDWLRSGQSQEDISEDEEHSLIHNSVPTKIAILLGVPKLSACLLSSESLDFEYEKSGPNEPVTTRIHNILEDYKEGVSVFKELIQNADDAGASKVCFLVDWRFGPTNKLLSQGMSECQGPALWAYNDGLFSDSDFENINKLAGATKKQDMSTIGRFGLGFNAVYNLTDVPSFVSREKFVMFDPNCHHLDLKDTSQPGMRINLAKTKKPLKVFGNQFQPYNGVFGCNMKYSPDKSFYFNGTLFRFPFRTLVQAGKSKICQKVYDGDKVEAMVDSLREGASLLLLYSENVTEVELFELKNNQNPEEMKMVLSVKKTGDNIGCSTPFIKTCAEWWHKKMRDEGTSGECPSKSQCITINTVKSTATSSGEMERSHLQETWLTSSCIGKESSCVMALKPEGRGKGLMPLAETATKLSSHERSSTKIPQAVSGEAFCFLPLSINTGLPVHINGFFAVTSNRRQIWEPGTTEHDKPFEGDWNLNLLSDAIACSYIQLLLEMKLRLPRDDTMSLQTMLPRHDNLHSTAWTPLAKSVYDKIVSESLAIFWCNEKWLDINSGYILDDGLRKAPGVIATMNSLEKDVLDLTEEVCESLKKFGHENTIRRRTLSLQGFFQELFLPNISKITHELREPLVRYGLECISAGHEELEMLFRDNECILNDDGNLKKPVELFVPDDQVLHELFFREPGKFPNQELVADSFSLLSVLKKLGLRNKDMIEPNELLKVASTISLSEFSDSMIKKSKALVSIFHYKKEYLSQHVNGQNTLRQKLRAIKWLPRARSPPESCRYPENMPWFDSEDAFVSPNELRGKSQALLIGSCMPIVDVIPDNLLLELGTVNELPLPKVVEQLSKVVQLWTNDSNMKPTSQFQDLILAIYEHLAEIPQDVLAEVLRQSELGHWIWHGEGFALPAQLAIENFLIDLHPYLFRLPTYLHQSEVLKEFFIRNGVRLKFSIEDIVSVLSSVKERHDDGSPKEAEEIKHDIHLCHSIVGWLVEGDEKLPVELQEKVMVPIQTRDESLVLKPCTDCTFCDHDWLRQGRSEFDIPEDVFLIDESISTKKARLLGVKPLSTCLMAGEELGFELTGQHEPLTTRLNNILNDYKVGVGIFKELIQNADDAGATKVCFLIDRRDGPKKSLFSPGMSECQGPALWAYNDGVFSDDDFKNINKLAGKTKKDDFTKIGRFGLGFNAVYHLTDVPSFVSREYLVVFDPNIQHLSGKVTESHPGLRFNLAKNARPLKTFTDQFQPYHDVFHCNTRPQNDEKFNFNGTLFRFPFRTRSQACRSKISEEYYDSERIQTLLDSLREAISLLTLYTQHVIEVEVFDLCQNDDPREMRLILSTKKNVESSGVHLDTPFIKTCAEWWGRKIRDEATSDECPSKLQSVTINIVKSTATSSGEIEQSHLQESWLTSSCMGKESSSAMALKPEGRENGLMPLAETAAKLKSDERSVTKIPQAILGEAFCFLPLSINTGLPLHINGFFAVTSNRRQIWEPGTTEHDKPFEGDWNLNLLSDAIACSYIELLLEIKRRLPRDDTMSLQTMLPRHDNLHSTAWTPLAKSVYDKIVSESLAIFWCNEKWLNINSGFILDDGLRKAPGVIATMNSLQKDVLDLTEEICESLKKFGHENTIRRRTLSLQRFFQELFLPNISKITHELRDPLVRYGLECISAGHEELEMLFRDNECILNDDGHLKKPAELFDPDDPLLHELFFREPGKFPNQELVADSFSLLSVLKKLGLRNKDMIESNEFLKVASTISLSEFSDSMIRKSKALVSIFHYKKEYLSQHVNGQNTLRQELRAIKWLPRARSPPESCRYPENMLWFDAQDAFFSPNELRGKSQALLIGSCMPIVDVIPDNLLLELGIVNDLPLPKVVEQLSKAVQVWTNDSNMKPTSQFQDLILAIYEHLAEIPQDVLAEVLRQSELGHWIYHGEGFALPAQLAIENFLIDLHPYLFRLPTFLHRSEELKEFFIRNGVRLKFSVEDIVSVLSSVKERHDDGSPKEAEEIKHDIHLCHSIVGWLVEGDEKLPVELQEKVMVPIQTRDESLVLKPCTDCTFCDHDWLRQGRSEFDIPEDVFLIDESISAKKARLLGVKPLSTCLMAGEELGFELTGQHEPLTTRLNNILREYKVGVGIFKELIQNADDAGATKVCFLIDRRDGPKKSLFSPGMSECQGPALWAYNDAVFSDDDFRNINKLAGKTKKDDFTKIGRFGLGFNAVYHLTDVPSFVSREYLVVFDPNIQHLSGKVTESHPGLRFNLAKNARPLKTFTDQFQLYHDVFHCNTRPQNDEKFNFNGTLFRFPFRTRSQACRSKISEEYYDSERIQTLLDSLREAISLLTLYTQHVIEVELFDLCQNDDPREMQLILSTKKNVESSGVHLDTPFIKTCAEWWGKKIRDEAISDECPSKLQSVTINIVKSTATSSGEIEQSHLQESWLTSSCMGKESSSAMALKPEGRENGLMPLAETAAKLKSDERSVTKIPQAILGEAFCFLPLSINTGLPVHINGFFAVTSNRRQIWEPGTTEHDKPFEGDWNERLLSDAIACSYIQLLLEIKRRLVRDETMSIQEMLPRHDSLHSTAWIPLAQGVYDIIVNESLAIFWCSEKWLDINSVYILDDDLQKAPGVIATMNSLEKNVLDLTGEVCESFKKFGHKDTIARRTLTPQRFFQELFLPNISKITHELREPLVRYGLECISAGHEELEMLFRDNECILNDDGHLKKPVELFDPDDSVLHELFFQEPGKFPSQELVANSVSLLPLLKKLGLRNKDMIKPEELLKVANTIALCECSDSMIKKSKALITILHSKKEYLSQHVNGGSTLKQELRGTKWVPRATSPPESCRYPENMPWFDVEDAFFSPDELRGKSQALLIGSCMPVVDVIPDNLLLDLGIVNELPLPKVVEQLSKAVHLWSNDSKMKPTSQFQDFILSIYQHLAKIPQDVLAEVLKQSELGHWIWHGEGFARPAKIAIENFLIDLHPYLFCLPTFLHQNEELKEFFIRNGVRVKFTKEDIVSILSSVKEKHEHASPKAAEDIKHDIHLCHSIVGWLVEDDEKLPVELQEKVMVPIRTNDQSLVLKPCTDCTFCDHDWLRQGRSELDIPEDVFLIDESLSTKKARLLGVKPLSTCLMAGEELGFELTGQHEPLTTRLNNILREYKVGVGVFKELIQNADDAGATKVCFLIDRRDGPKKSLFSPDMSECQGPALWAYNDAVFSDDDFRNINKLAGKTKKEDLGKIGRFGLGFNAVYHLTDVPSFLSRESFVVFDPNVQNLSGIITESHPGLRIDLEKNTRPLKTFTDQFQSYHDVFQCNTRPQNDERFYFNGTLFRFPFRTKLQAARSEISEEVYDAKKIETLIDSLREGISLLTLYTQHVVEVEAYDLDQNKDPREMRLILSAKKNVESVNLEASTNVQLGTFGVSRNAFIKECSEWWKANLLNDSVLPSPSRSEVVSIHITETDTKRNEHWLVSSCMGTDSSLRLAKNEGQNDGLLPCAGTATKLSSDETTRTPKAILGEAFCFLPLSIATGLPVHVNSSFAVMSNRRSLWERSSSTQLQDLEVRWNESLMSDAVCNAYVQLLETVKLMCERGALQDYPFHALWPCYKNLKSNSWKTLVNNVYRKIVENSLPLLRSNERWLDINSGHILADDLRQAPEITVAMRELNQNVFELPEDVFNTLKECGQAETLQKRTLTLEGFFTDFFFPNILTLSHEVRNALVQFGLDCISSKEELALHFKENACIPCSQDGNKLAKPANLINPNEAAAKLFSPEDNRFPVGEEFLTEDRVFVLEKLGMKKDLLSWEEIYERARSVELLAKTCYEKALERSCKMIEYLNKFIDKLPGLEKDEETIQKIQFLPFIKEFPKGYERGLPWKGSERKKEQFCSAKELFVPRRMDLVGSCCFILSTHGCGKLEKKVEDVLGLSYKIPSHQQVLEQLDSIIQVWSTFKEKDREQNVAKVESICHSVYKYLDKYFTKVKGSAVVTDKEVNNSKEKTINDKGETNDGKRETNNDEGETNNDKGETNDCKGDTNDVKKELVNELTKRKWLFIEDTFVPSDKVARYWCKSGAPYLYGVPACFKTDFKNLQEVTAIKERFDANDFFDAINELKDSKGFTPLTDQELEVAVTFLNELKDVSDEFCKENADRFYLPDHLKIFGKADELTINNTPWLPNRGDSRDVHKDITPGLAFKLGTKSLLDKRLGKYSNTLCQFGQHENLTDRLKGILDKSYHCDSGILKELVQNADDAQATEIHFIYDTRTLPHEGTFQNKAEEIQGPALCIYNNKKFSDSDLEGIQKLGIGSKVDNAEKTGQFGIGFNAVYHLTDCPSFISNGETLCILDPHCRYAPGATPHRPGARFDEVDKEFKEDFPDLMNGYLEDFGFDLQGSTMFRLPLRSLERSEHSEISKKVGVYKIKSLLNEFKVEAKRSMLFLNHIKMISISEINDNGTLAKTYEVTSNVDEEDMKKLEALHKEEFKHAQTRDIPWQGVTFPVVLADTNGCVEHWLVHQCCGVEVCDEEDVIPDGRSNKLLPFGGLAALVESNKRKTSSIEAPSYLAYCFLPLPVRTSLPVHVNGHFAVDPGRRGLWKDADSKDPFALWNRMIKKNVLAPGYAKLILEARKFMLFGELESDDKTSCFFPGAASADAGLSWYHNLFPTIQDNDWSVLSLALYAYLAKNREPALPIVTADEAKPNERPDDMPRRIKRWLPVQEVFFVDKYKYPKNPDITDEHIKIFLDIRLPVARYARISVQQGFEKAGITLRVVSPESIVSALGNFLSTSSECRIGVLPCNIEATTIAKVSNLIKLIVYCKNVENFRGRLNGLPLLLTADNMLRVFSPNEKVYCSEFCDLFPRRSTTFVHPKIVPFLSSLLKGDKPASTSGEKSNDSSSDTMVTPPSFPTALLPLTTVVVETFMLDVFPNHTKNARVHLDFDATDISEDWLKRFWMYLLTYSKEIDDKVSPLDAFKAWPIIPTTSKKLVTVNMGRTVLDMKLVGNESDTTLKVLESLKKLNCPTLDTSITLPEPEPHNRSIIGSIVSSVASIMFSQEDKKKEPFVTITNSYVSRPHVVPDVLDVFDFMVKHGSLDGGALSEDDITGILQFIQDGYKNLETKEKYNEILKQLPFYKSINGEHYKLSAFSEYAVVPANVPAEEINKLQERTDCLFIHPDMLQALENLLTELGAGAKRSNADFYMSYILPNFSIFSDGMRLRHLTHIRDSVLPSLYHDTGLKTRFLKDLRRWKCIRNRYGEYVHASQFYDPRNEVLRIMEDESSDKFPPPPFVDTKWLDFLIQIGMINEIDETLFMKFAYLVANDGNSSPTNEKNKQRSKALLKLLFSKHHLHGQRFLCGLSTVKFISSEKVEPVYLSLYKQHGCSQKCDHLPFVEFSNAVPWKYRSLVWTSGNLLPEFSYDCIDPECKTEDVYKNLEVKYPSSEMVIRHLQNISGELAESSNREQALPQNAQLINIMNNIYEFLQRATNCEGKDISAKCSNTCKMIGNCLESTPCILVPVDEPKTVVKGDQLSFKILDDKSLLPYIYVVPREYGKLQHLLKRLGATETITPLQIVNVLERMKNRTKHHVLDPNLEKIAQNAMFLLFELVLREAKDKEQQSSLANVQELYLPSVEKRLIKSSELLCKIPPRHIKTIERLGDYHALYFFEGCGLKRELESEYLNALPATLRCKPFSEVAKETLDESCLEKRCQMCNNSEDGACEFIKKFKVLVKSEDFKNGIIRLLKHQKASSKLSQEDEQAASRLFLEKVEIKCMETVQVHLVLTKTNEVLEGTSCNRTSFVVNRSHDTWVLYIEHGQISISLATSINKILDWKINKELLLNVTGMLNCTTPFKIPEVLDESDIAVDAGRNEDVKLGSKVPAVFYQLLQQNPLFVFAPGELVTYCTELADDADQEPSYILAEIIKRVTSNSAGGSYDLEAIYLINIGSETKEVSVLDLYKFCMDYPDENSCKDLVPFTGEAAKKPESYDEAKREILEALRAAWRLPPELRRRAIRRLYLRWHPDKNPDNVEFANEMMAFLLEQIRLMEQEEKELTEKPENFNFEEMFQRCNQQASRDNATFYNFRSHCSFPTSGHRSFPTSGHRSPSSGFPFDPAMFRSAEEYTSPQPAEAKRWLTQAEGDLSACQQLRAPSKPFDAVACFMSQQIVEKSLKAALYYECGLTNEQLHTHDIYILATKVNNLRRWENDEIMRLALHVANYYLPTRYPNALSYPKIPHYSFDGQSGDAVASAGEVLRLVKQFMRN